MGAGGHGEEIDPDSAPPVHPPGRSVTGIGRDGLDDRHIGASVPPSVDYELTPLGRSLLPIQRPVKDRAEGHIEEVHTARKRYNSAQQRN